MTIREQQANSIDWLRERLDPEGGESFTWQDTITVPCIVDTLLRGLELHPGGKRNTVVFTLRVKRSEFLTADSSLITVDSELWTADDTGRHPVAGKTLVFRGKTYRIGTASEDGSRAYYKLDLVDPHSGR